MNCNMTICIYNKNTQCALDEININSLGMCDDCIIVSIDEDLLAKEKAHQLKEIERRE